MTEKSKRTGGRSKDTQNRIKFKKKKEKIKNKCNK